MADIRINALANTATTPASDDYLALDGAAQGTRKILATNIANNVTDVILGTSGPSVKSSLSARAPRQGLVFDGTSGATVSVPAFGTADFTVSLCLKPTTLANSQRFLGGTANGFEMATDASGGIFIIKNGVATTGSWASVLTAGKWQTVTYRRTGGVGTLYINGVANGSTISDSVDYSGGIGFIGAAAASGATVSISSLVPLIYNRALSASEVVALYEAGAPAGADYNSASNTALNVATFTNSNIYPYGTFSGASTTGFTAVSNGTGFQAAFANTSITFKTGTKYRLTYTLTLNSGAAPFFVLGNPGVAGYSTPVQLSAGTNSVEVTATASATSAQGFGFQHNSSAGNYAISNISLVAVGLLLAPDAAQAGGGLVWYDTSGNAANITLPASGVTWNVPTSSKTATGWTFGGNLTVSGAAVTMDSTSAGVGFRGTSGGHNRFSLIRDDTLYPGSVLLSAFGEVDLMYGATTTATSGTVGARLTASGNFMIGSTGADGGQKLQVNGTAFANRYDVLFNDNPAGTSPRIFASAAAGSTVDVLVAGAGSRAGNIQYYNDGGGTSQLKFGTSVPSSTTEHVRFSMPTSGLGSSVVSIYGTTASTSTTTGALVVSGGVGVAGAVNVGGAIAIGNTVQTAAAVASTHKVTISIGGSTYYLLATNV